MRIAVFGASGRTGIPLVEQALTAGNEVRALVRNPDKFPFQNPALTIVKGNVLSVEDVEQAVQESDAVISVLGHTSTSPNDVLTQAIRNIIAAMEKYDVQRLVSLTSTEVRAPQDQPRISDRLMSIASKLLSKEILMDAMNQVEEIKRSNLEWVVVRVPVLRDGPHTGQYKVGWVGMHMGGHITRADAADFMLKQALDPMYVRQMPMVSN